MKIHSAGFKLVKFIFLIAVIVYLFLFNLGAAELRMDEINESMKRISNREYSAGFLGLIGRYELIRSRFEADKGGLDDYKQEARLIAALSSSGPGGGELAVIKRGLLPARLMRSFIRVMSGKQLPKVFENYEELDRELELAYFFERRRYYKKAVESYEAILSRENRREKAAVILLHKAFCLSMLDDYANSKLLYQTVMQEYPDTEAGVQSKKMISFIEFIDSRKKQVAEIKEDSFTTAKNYYLFMEYSRAVDAFSSWILENPASSRIEEAIFFKARSLEETGRVRAAVSEYNKILSRSNQSRWAVEANRRLLMIGDFYENSKELSDKAREDAVRLRDSTFIRDIEHYAEISRQNLVPEEILKSELTETKAVSGEIIIRTQPVKADIYIDGVLKGQAPLVLELLPAGEIRIEARAAGMSTSQLIMLKKNLSMEIILQLKQEAKIQPELKPADNRTELKPAESKPAVKAPVLPDSGSVEIKSGSGLYSVYINNEFKGSSREAVYENLQPGTYSLVLRGEGAEWEGWYYEGSFTVKAGSRTRISPKPKAYGSLDYKLPAEAKAEIVSQDFRATLTGSGFIERIPAGIYNINISGGPWVPSMIRVEIKRAAASVLAPVLEKR